MNDIPEKVNQAIMEILGVEDAKFDSNTMIEDIGVDSVEAVDLTLSLGRVFKINSLNPYRFHTFITLGDLYGFIKSELEHVK